MLLFVLKDSRMQDLLPFVLSGQEKLQCFETTMGCKDISISSRRYGMIGITSAQRCGFSLPLGPGGNLMAQSRDLFFALGLFLVPSTSTASYGEFSIADFLSRYISSITRMRLLRSRLKLKIP